MSLEKALADNTAAIERQNELLEQVLGQAKENRKAKSEADDEPAPRSRRAAKEEPEDDEPPARGRRAAAKEEDDEPPARSRRAAKEEPPEDDEPPKRSRRAAKEEDDEPPARGRKAADKKKPKGPTIADVQKAFAAFLDVSDIKDAKKAKAEEKDRRAFLNDMLDHLDVENTAAIKEEDFETVMDWAKRFADGEEVEFD